MEHILLTHNVKVCLFVVYILVALINITALILKFMKKNVANFITRMKSFWIILILFTLAFCINKIVAFFFIMLISYLALKEYFSMIPTRRSDRRVLLCALSKLPARTLIDGDKIFTEFNGSLAEQYVLQQLKTLEDMEVAYWISKSGNAEIDFVIQTDGYVIPVEVKATTNLQAKSLKVYREKFEPEISIRTSLADFEINKGLYNIPLFMAGKVDKILKDGR